jgi:hypothetical protein
MATYSELPDPPESPKKQGRNMPAKEFYKIVNAEGHYFDNNNFGPNNHGQIFKVHNDALAVARRLAINDGHNCTLETCVTVPVSQEVMFDDPQVLYLIEVRQKLKNIDGNIAQHLFRMSLTHDVREYPFVIHRNPIDKSENKFIKTEAEIDYVISSKKTRWRYLSVRTLDDVMMLKLIMGADFLMAIDLETFEVLK